jgi:hypothetical protein
MQAQTQTPRRKIVLLNAVSMTMIPNGGNISAEPISVEEVRKLVKSGVQIESYIGHAGTAQLVSQLLGIEVPTNRAMFVAKEPSEAIIVSITERLPEGKVLSREELEQLLAQGKIRFYIAAITPRF